jgi:hypothetical protein
MSTWTSVRLHSQAIDALETLEDPAHDGTLSRLFELVGEGLTGGSQLLAQEQQAAHLTHSTPPSATRSMLLAWVTGGGSLLRVDLDGVQIHLDRDPSALLRS